MSSKMSGKWYNQHGSVLEVETDSSGRIHGSFRSGVGFPDPDEEFPVAGFFTGGLVGFTVSFPRHESLTSWTGHLGIEDGRETIYALWHMSIAVPATGRAGQLWQGIWSGADTFRRTCEESLRPPGHNASHPVAEARNALAADRASGS